MIHAYYALWPVVFQSKQGLEHEKVDYLTMRLQTVETENDRLKTDAVRLKNENDRLRMVGDGSCYNC